MEWFLGIYAIGACLMAGFLFGLAIADEENREFGWAEALVLFVMSALWWLAVAWAVAGHVHAWKVGRRSARLDRRPKPRPRFYYRWSDHDRRWWRFIYARDSRGYRPLGIVLSSLGGPAHDDFDQKPINTLRLSGFGHTLIVVLPQIIKPWKRWVDTSHYDWSSNPQGGYWDTGAREYGFTINDGHLSVGYGRVTNDSGAEQRWGWFLPWRSWRYIRFSVYGYQGEHIWSQFDRDRPKLAKVPKEGFKIGASVEATDWAASRERQIDWDKQRRVAEDAAGRMSFEFLDFDKVRITAETQIHEREWALGEGRFKWLSWFVPNKVRRSLDIRFSDETGRRKGSWKGGTIGSSIDMLPGELHEAAFARYAAAHEMTYPAAERPEAVEGVPLDRFGKHGVAVPMRTGFSAMDAAAKQIQSEAEKAGFAKIGDLARKLGGEV